MTGMTLQPFVYLILGCSKFILGQCLQWKSVCLKFCLDQISRKKTLLSCITNFLPISCLRLYMLRFGGVDARVGV